MIIKIKKWFILFIMIVLLGCPVYDPKMEVILIHNDSKVPIYIYDSCDKFLPKYPQMTINPIISFDGEMKKNAIHYMIPPDSTLPSLYYYSLKSFFEGCSEKKAYFYFLTEEVIKENSWERIHEEQLFKKRYNYTYEELKALDWMINYVE